MRYSDYFVAEFDTTKISTGSSASNQLTLPLVSVGAGITIEWGDGTSQDVITATSTTHTYAISGIYVVKIKGNFILRYINSSDRLKIGIIWSWGLFSLSRTNIFQGCANLRLEYASGKPILVVSLNQAFDGCSNLTTIRGLSDWKLNDVTDWRVAFRGCTNFNDPQISGFTISGNFITAFRDTTNFNQPLNFGTITSATDAFRGSAFNHDISHATFDKNCLVTNMLAGKTPSTYNAVHLANLYIKFASSFVGTGRTQTIKTFSAGTAKYDSSGASARATLVADGWTLTDGGLL